MTRVRRANGLAVGMMALLSLVAAGGKKPKKIKATTNPPEYVAFSKPLSWDLEFRHALDRLTFGAGPGDLDQIRRIGLEKWINLELHPERVPENSVLEQRLAPLASLRMSIHETYVHYPSPQMIAAFARGRGQLSDDPDLRAIVVRLADRYLKKREARLENASGSPDQIGASKSNDDPIWISRSNCPTS